MSHGPKFLILGSILASLVISSILYRINGGGLFLELREVKIQTGNKSASDQVCAISKYYPHKIMKWCGMITHYAHEYDLSPNLVAAIVWQESGGNPRAVSNSGAVGLMQVMPHDGAAASFMCLNGPCFKDRPPSRKLKNPEFNISYGTRMLSRLVKKHGSMRDALKSYGPMDAGYYYADKVMNIYRRSKQKP